MLKVLEPEVGRRKTEVGRISEEDFGIRTSDFRLRTSGQSLGILVKIKRSILLAYFVLLPVQTLFSQHITRDNYTGAWEDPRSWDPEWPIPVSDSLNINITVFGNITFFGSISFANTTTNFIISDTLVILGDLYLGNKTRLTIQDKGILIIRGNLYITNKTEIISNGYLIIVDNIFKRGSQIQGSFTNNDTIVKLFIGGSIPKDLADNPLYPVLDTILPFIFASYPNSGYSFGNLTDLKDDPVNSFFVSTCYTQSAKGNNNTPLCAGNAIRLHAEGGVKYLWTGPANFSSTFQNPVIIKAIPSNTGNYTVNITGASGCASSVKTVTFTIKESPVAKAAHTRPVCTGGNIILSTVKGNMTVNWTGPVAFESNLFNPVLIGAQESNSGKYEVVVVAPNGCSAKDSTYVNVYKIPSADAGKDQILDSEFETAMSGVLPSDAEGEWSVVSGWGNFVDKKSPLTVVNRLTQGENIFRWEVWNIHEAACSASSEVMVTVKDLFIPSVITPNGDGVNDLFRINVSEEGIRLSIFNKWGVREYESSSYHNDWDGTGANGHQLPEDTYFYILDFKGLKRKGAILIIR